MAGESTALKEAVTPVVEKTAEALPKGWGVVENGIVKNVTGETGKQAAKRIAGQVGGKVLGAAAKAAPIALGLNDLGSMHVDKVYGGTFAEDTFSGRTNTKKAEALVKSGKAKDINEAKKIVYEESKKNPVLFDFQSSDVSEIPTLATVNNTVKDVSNAKPGDIVIRSNGKAAVLTQGDINHAKELMKPKAPEEMDYEQYIKDFQSNPESMKMAGVSSETAPKGEQVAEGVKKWGDVQPLPGNFWKDLDDKFKTEKTENKEDKNASKTESSVKTVEPKKTEIPDYHNIISYYRTGGYGDPSTGRAKYDMGMAILEQLGKTASSVGSIAMQNAGKGATAVNDTQFDREQAQAMSSDYQFRDKDKTLDVDIERMRNQLLNDKESAQFLKDLDKQMATWEIDKMDEWGANEKLLEHIKNIVAAKGNQLPQTFKNILAQKGIEAGSQAIVSALSAISKL